MNNKPKRQGGFSLLEVLVAFSILALSLGVLLRIFGGDGRLAGMADEHSRAVVLAESLLANVGIETSLQPGQFGGAFDDRFDWEMRVAPFIPPSEPMPENLPFKPYWVELTILWGKDESPRSLTLSTLRFTVQNRQTGLAPRR